ncbi:MerR family transcriptional regulator [Streptococcus dentiloxodontae]
MPYTIKEVSEMIGVSPSTLRYYEQQGLLPMVSRKNGIRVFEDGDFEWLHILHCLKKTGMPIKKIKKYVDLSKKGDSSLEKHYQLIQEQKERVLSQIEELHYFLKEIEAKEEYYQKALKPLKNH